MAALRQQAQTSRASASGALATAKRRAGATRPQDAAVLALQRSAGNAAVGALMAARLRSPGEAAAKDIDDAMRELRRNEPGIDTVERGLKAAKTLGVPVDLEGTRPPPSALAVITTGFGPGNVPAKKPVPPPKPVPAVSPLGRAGAKKAPAVRTTVGSRPAPPPMGAATAAPRAPAELSADQLLLPPARPVPVRPQDDPAFTRVTGTVKATGRQQRSHPPAGTKAKEAQDAALPPTNDIGSQAKAAKADAMDAQRPGTFDKKAFIAAVKAAIEAKSPKTLEEADSQKGSDKAAEVKGEVKSLVSEGEKGQVADIAAATEAPPDQSKAVPKPVTPMITESPGTAAPIPASGAVPKPAPADQLNLAAGKHETDAELAAGEVSEQQLAESNEPQFQQALADKNAAAVHADTAPGEYRQQEQQVIGQGRASATAETAAGVAGMQSARGGALAQLVAAKAGTKTKDETRRAEVSARIEQIFTTTETDVKKILDGIDPKVEKQFDAGEAVARRMFESYVQTKMSAYKKDRYGGWLGGYRWLKDKIFDLPAKVNEFYVAGRELYLKEMDRTITTVADTVSNDLNAAKTRIATGRAQIADYVNGLPKDLKQVGAEASKQIGERFEQLESDVDSKSEALVDTLATKYVEARKGLDERIEQLQEENKGLVSKAVGAIKAVVNTVRELVAMLRNALARAVGVVGDIAKAPVKFLGNLIAGVKGGILKFKDDILGHLRRGLMSWLFGALAEGGVELPKSFDLKGIVGFLASIFGLTWTNIRNRIVKRIGETAMGAVEKGVEIFQVVAGPDGIGGLWQMLVDKLGDIKEMIFQKVKDFVQDRIISAGITWLIGLLNPAGAFIKACKLIYDIVMFFVDNAARIAKFVNTVLDSVVDIVRGNISGVVSKINDVLGQMVPIIIGFLASVIGLGGIGQKIREIIGKLQKPVTKAIDFVIDKGLKLAGPIIRGIKGIGKKVKGKIEAGKKLVKARVEASKKLVKSKLGLDSKAVRKTARARILDLLRSGMTAAELRSRLPAVMDALRPQGLKRLEMGDQGANGVIEVKAEASPFDRLIKLIPSHLRRYKEKEGTYTKGTPYVTMKITVSLVDAKQQLSAKTAGTRRQPSGDIKMPPVSIDAARPRGYSGFASSTQKAGGLIEPPQPGETAIRMVTFNTAEGSPVDSNTTHAERQFVNWLDQEDPVWRQRITGVAIDMNISPCTICTEDLRRVPGLTPVSTKATRVLKWVKPYVDKKRTGDQNRSTTTESLSKIANAGWTVSPSSVEPGRLTEPTAIAVPSVPLDQQKLVEDKERTPGA